MYSYVFKRITCSWSLFIAFFLGLTLAVSLFTGILIGADAIGTQTLQAALTNIPVDIVSARDARNYTSNIDASLASLSSISEVTHTEAMYKISAEVWDPNSNFTAPFSIVGLSSSSSLLKDGVFSNTQSSLGSNSAFIEEGSANASRFLPGDILTLGIRVQSSTTKATHFFLYNLTLSSKVQLSDKAFTAAALTSTNNAGVLFRQLILGGQVRRPPYSIMIISDKTFLNILNTIHGENSLPADSVPLVILTWLDHAAVSPWDIEQSTTDVRRIQALVDNSVRKDGYTTTNLLAVTLTAIQQYVNELQVGLIVLALPVIVASWYMGRIVSDVSLNMRRKEIGLLLTKGFSRNQVLRLILSETILLSVIAGALGVAIGVAILPFANVETNILDGFQLLDVSTVVLVMIFSISMAVLAVYYPARRASRMKTVEAIREYAPEESEARPKMLWPAVALILGTYKIAANLVGFSLSAYAPPARQLFVNLLFVIARFFDQILLYIAPVLFFWGFSKIFIQGSFRLQDLLGRISKRFASGLGEVAAENSKLNTRRTAAVVFMLALIVGYSVSVIGAVASTNDFIQRSISNNVGADISVQMFTETNTTLVKNLVDSYPSVSSSTIERWVFADTSFGTIEVHIIDPVAWQNTAYYEPNWFTGATSNNAIQGLASDNETIILDSSLADQYGITVGQDIAVTLGFKTYSLRVVGFFGAEVIPTAVAATEQTNRPNRGATAVHMVIHSRRPL